MASQYFANLREKGRKLDEGIEVLTQTWEMPKLLIGGYGDCTSETKGYIEDIKNTLKKMSVEIDTTIDDLNSVGSRNEELLKEADLTYQDLKGQCENLEIVLSEYGYQYNGPTTLEQKAKESFEISKEMEKCNISSLNEKSDSELQFTPDLSWKYKTKPKEYMFTPAHDKCLASPSDLEEPSVTNYISPAQMFTTPVSRKY